MMQVIPKWKVSAQFVDREVVVYVSDPHIGNVLRIVSTMDFSPNALEPIKRITVELKAK